MITKRELGHRLRLARLDTGLTQEDVAQQLGLPRPAISQLEAGKRSVDSLELAKLARLYGRPLLSFFDDQSEISTTEEPLTVLFRATELRPEDQGIIRDFEHFCRTYAEVEDLLDRASEVSLPDYSSIGEPRTKLEAIRHGEQVAAEERRRLGVGDDPIRNIFELLESQGVRLQIKPLQETAISGLFLFERSLGPCILINGSEHRDRLAFNAAHEYAHVLLDRRLLARASTASRLLGEADEAEELLEVRANSFAAALLLPPSGIERFLLSRGRSPHHSVPCDVVDVLHLQRAFGVSYQATLYRLQNLGWIDRSRREALARYSPGLMAKALGLDDDVHSRRKEPSGEVFPLRFVHLVLEAHRVRKIPLSRLAELLNKTLPEARELVSALGF